MSDTVPAMAAVDILIHQDIGHPAQFEVTIISSEGNGDAAIGTGDNPLASVNDTIGGQYPFNTGCGNCLDRTVNDKRFTDGLVTCSHDIPSLG